MNRSETALGFARGVNHDLSNLFELFFGSDGPGRSDGHVSLPSRLASSTSASAVTSLLPAPSVTTDQDDYAPDSTATITASGFEVGADVTFEVDHVAENGEGADGVYGTADDVIVELGGDGHDPWTVTDGGAGDLDGVANGTIVTTWHVNADDSLNERFVVTASDGEQTATNTFTDGPALSGPSGGFSGDLDPVTPGVQFTQAAVDMTYFQNDGGDIVGQFALYGQFGSQSDAVFSNDVFGAGTGIIDPFVRLQNNEVEQGVNTSGTTVYHEKAADFTRNLTLGEVAVFGNADDPILTFGEFFYQFRLDINENSNSANQEFLALDEIKIFVSDTADLTFAPPPGSGAGAKLPLLDPGEGDFILESDGSFNSAQHVELVWDLDGGAEGDTWIALNYDLQAGSGVGDIAMYINREDFNDAVDTLETDNPGLVLTPATTYVYLYSAFGYTAYALGDAGGTAIAGTAFDVDGDFVPIDFNASQPALWESSDGFEEWSILKGGSPAAIEGFKREDINGDGDDEAGADPGIVGWQIDLYLDDGDGFFEPGTDDLLVTSVDTANGTTDDLDGDGVIDDEGFYHFGGLGAGSYWIEEEAQTGWTNSTPTVIGPIDLIGGDLYGDEGTENTTFLNFELFDISGTKYTDITGDGITGDDTVLGGVTIFIDVNGNGLNDDGAANQTITAADGTWSFSDLDASYDGLTVYEVLPTGHVQTVGNAGYDIVGTSGNDQTGLDFANFELFDISGTKYTDITGDGITGDDTVLGGVTIFIDVNGNGLNDDGAANQTITAADGTWSFSDLDASYDGLTVYEVLPTGHVQTVGNAGYDIVGTSGNDQTGLDFANFELFDISGTKYTDITGDGITGDDTVLGGVTIFIDVNGNGLNDDGAANQTITAADGTWSFSDLDASYDGLTVYEVLPTGHVQTVGNAGYDIVGTSGNDQTGLDFANFELFDISGTKYTDITGDGITGDDTVLGGVTIFIDVNGNGANDDGAANQTVTAADGTWSFTGLDASYDGLTVYEVLPTGHVQTVGNAGYDIVGTSGNDQTGLDFANFELFDISGTKYTDITGDGITGDDTVLGGVTIFIDVNGNGANDDGAANQTITAADGTWSFTGLDASYDGLTVYEVLPTGHVQTVGNAGYDIVGTSGNDQTGLDFANFELFDISGTKYTDITGDGITGDDTVLGGVTIFIDVNGNGANDDGAANQTITAADGTWSFTGLDASYDGLTVYEVLPTGHVQTVGNAGYDIVGTSGNDQTGLDFANFELFDISGTKYTDITGDGITGDDTVLGGVTIFIDVNGNGANDDGAANQTITAADGTWSFTDLDYSYAGLNVFEVLPTGYVQTVGQAGYAITGTSGTDQTGLDFANFELFGISGTKYTDITGDGITGDDTVLGGVTIFIDVNGNGANDDGAANQTVTAADGTWSFTDLDASYAGLNVFEVLPTGYVQTVGQAGYAITGTSSQTGLDFANFELFDISGTKYTDITGDGITGDDTVLGGVTIFIDVNGNGANDDGAANQTITAADGTWSFTDLDYSYDGMTVYEVLPDDSVQTLGNAGYDIVGTSGNDQTGLDFANFRLFDISGTKREDIDGDGDGDGTWTYGAVTIFIDVDDSGDLSAGDETTTTAADGTWSFTDLDYSYDGMTVYEVLPDDSVQTLGNAGYDIVGTSGNDQTGLDFANFRLFDISGTKREDIDGDGDGDGTWTYGAVTIFIDFNGNGLNDDGAANQTVTAADGTWSFTDLDFTYAGKKVYEVVPDGSVQTLGELGHLITGTSGADQTGLDFANFRLFDISGTKYTDITGDGITGDDTVLGGVTIFIDVNGNGANDDGAANQTITAADGTWSFTGLDASYDGLTVYEVLPTGHVQTVGNAGYDIVGTSGNDQTGLDFANFELFDISGTKYTDITGDGITGDDTVLGGVTIFIDVNGNGANDDGAANQTITAADGTWSFTGLDASYDGLTVYEVLPTGHVQTVGNAGYDIVGTSGNDQTGLDFANFELFDISGTKYTDITGDGITGDDTVLGGVTIFIDVNGNGANDDGAANQTITAADGTWSFTGLDASYDGLTVYEVLPTGHVQTVGNAGYDIVGTSGNDQTGLDFANFELFDISGTKYTDITGDGITGDDTVLGGVTIFIDVNGNGANDDGAANQTITAADGTWSFTDLDYSYAGLNVFEVLPTGYVQTVGQAGYAITGTSGTDQTGLDFANFELMDVSGYKWADLNGDGAWDDPGEAGLESWVIYLDNDEDVGNGFIASTTTDANGFYEFTGIGPDDFGTDADGILHVYEAQQDGFTQTYGGFSFDILSGLVIDGTLGEAEEGNFGNHMMEGANRTPGFWQGDLGKSLYDGDPDNNGDVGGSDGDDKDFAEEGWTTFDLLAAYGFDDDQGTDDGNPNNNTHFKIWDADWSSDDGTRDVDEDIYVTLEQLCAWVGGEQAGKKGRGREDFKDILERDVAASLLNTLNNFGLGDDDDGDPSDPPAPDSDIIDSYEDALHFIFNAPGGKKNQKSAWSDYGSDAHTELAAYNENGEAMMASTLTQIAMDGDDYGDTVVQNYLAIEDGFDLV